jgi:hypothetical protein
VDAVDAIDCILVAGGNLHLFMRCLLLPLLLTLVELHEFLLELERSLLLLLPLLPLLLLVPPVDLL